MTQQTNAPWPQLEPWLRIRIDDPGSLGFWACLLDSSAERLSQAVAHVGDDVHDVADYFRRQDLLLQDKRPGKSG